MKKTKKTKISVGLGIDIFHYRDGKLKLGSEITTEDFYGHQLVYIAISLFKYRLRIGYVGHEEDQE